MSKRIGVVVLSIVVPAIFVGTAAHADQPADGKQLQFTQLVQEQDEWCWDASGLSIAQYLGYGADVDQNTFCDDARGLAAGQQCPNQPGEFSDVQAAYSKLGLGQGQTAGALDFSAVQGEIDANRPIETGIYWTAGGGHAQVIYGYDPTTQTLSYGDPWPDSNRYNEMAYTDYTSNSQFNWGESLYEIGQ
jgi:hypothetical protein